MASWWLQGWLFAVCQRYKFVDSTEDEDIGDDLDDGDREDCDDDDDHGNKKSQIRKKRVMHTTTGRNMMTKRGS